MKKLLLLACLVLALLGVAGCGDDGDSLDAVEAASAADSPQLDVAALAELDSFLNDDGRPDRHSILAAWEWMKRTFRYDQNDADYEFSPEELHEVAQLAVGLPVREGWDVILKELQRRRPGKMAETPRWTFNSAGTAFCSIAIVYASTKEYVAFFGTPIGADGFSGRYKADVWDLMIDGEMWTFTPGEFEKTVYLAGDLAYLPADGGKSVQYVNHAWMIDYGRGNVITMFPFGVIAPALFVTLDYQSAWEQFVDFAKLAIQNLLNP